MSDEQVKAEVRAMQKVAQAKQLLIDAAAETGLYRDVIHDALDTLPFADDWHRAIEEAR